MVMALGRGNNTSTVIQTIGRATGNGGNVLKENGFDCVRVLTTSNDLTLCIKYRKYIREISDRMRGGDTFEQAVSLFIFQVPIFLHESHLHLAVTQMTGANTKISDDANFIRHTFRKTAHCL